MYGIRGLYLFGTIVSLDPLVAIRPSGNMETGQVDGFVEEL